MNGNTLSFYLSYVDMGPLAVAIVHRGTVARGFLMVKRRHSPYCADLSWLSEISYRRGEATRFVRAYATKTIPRLCRSQASVPLST